MRVTQGSEPLHQGRTGLERARVLLLRGEAEVESRALDKGASDLDEESREARCAPCNASFVEIADTRTVRGALQCLAVWSKNEALQPVAFPTVLTPLQF